VSAPFNPSSVPYPTGSVEYPAAPAGVPGDLTAPSRSYRVCAWLALTGLVGFFGLYFAISAWFAWLAYYLVAEVLEKEGGGVWTVLVAIGAACWLSSC
jgi:hypothetical protein